MSVPASALTSKELIRTIKVAAVTAGVVFLMAQCVPDLRSPEYRMFEIEEFKKDIEKSLVVHRERKRQEKTRV